jgi:hypothetical protein
LAVLLRNFPATRRVCLCVTFLERHPTAVVVLSQLAVEIAGKVDELCGELARRS